MFKRLIIKILFRLLDENLKIEYNKIDKQSLEQWAFESFDNKGWRSYFAYEDLKILKALAQGQQRDQYFLLIGRRLQLLYLFDEMRKAFQLRKSAEEKKNK